MKGGQQQGYDQAVTLFSPDGSLYQVQYAKKAVDRGNLSLGITFPDGFVLVSDGGPLNPLQERRADKVTPLDDHLGCVTSGLVGDARVVIDRIRQEAQSHRMKYGEPIDSAEAAKRAGRLLHSHTQRGGVRPFGVSVILAGALDKGRMFLSGPGGTFQEMEAAAIGRGRKDATEALAERRDEAEDEETALATALQILSDTVGEDLEDRSVEVAVGRDGEMRALTPDEIDEELEKAL